MAAAPASFARPHVAGCVLMLKVVPGASRSRVVGPMADGALKVAVAKPPAGGQANEAVLDLLAKALGVPRRAVELTTGAGSARKTVLIHGVDVATVRARLGGEDGGA
jgi:uncharacterized protein (TIGR00251 family)